MLHLEILCLDIRACFVVCLPLLCLHFNELNCTEWNIPGENKTRVHECILSVCLYVQYNTTGSKFYVLWPPCAQNSRYIKLLGERGQLLIKIKFKIKIRGLWNETPRTGEIRSNTGKECGFPVLRVGVTLKKETPRLSENVAHCFTSHNTVNVPVTIVGTLKTK